MGIDTGIASRASEVLVFSVRDVLLGPGIPILLGQAKVNDEQLCSEGGVEGEEENEEGGHSRKTMRKEGMAGDEEEGGHGRR